MESDDRPLIKSMKAFIESIPVSFHVPGHKHGLLSGLPDSIKSALQYDLTELEGLDDLHEPNGVIGNAQRKLANVYHSNKSYFLVNGSTVGNLAMIYAMCRSGDTIIVQRNAHKSIFHAIELTDAHAVYVSPIWDVHTKATGCLTKAQIENALLQYPDAKAVVLTYPTYYGKTGTELEKIIQLCHINRVPVLVDEAHGAHFILGDPFPPSALELGADIVVQSAHKTLPAMTMASFLHVRSDLISYERVAHYLKMLQSSSPSYLLMASLDDARSFIASYNEEDKISFMNRRMAFIEHLQTIKDLTTLATDDPLKLLLRVEGHSGFAIQQQLEREGIYAELADPYQVLFVLPLLKVKAEYAFEEISRKVSTAVIRLKELPYTAYKLDVPPIITDISELIYTPKELEEKESVWMAYQDAVGQVSAATIIPYPPGVPLLIAGEKILENHLQSLKQLLRMNAKFQGLIRVDKQEISVVKNRAGE